MQEGEQGQQEVVVVLEEGTMSGDGEGQPKEPGMYRTHTMVLPPKHPVLTRCRCWSCPGSSPCSLDELFFLPSE
eukprot:1157241-Pelagomonas_calceolata.AAC.5